MQEKETAPAHKPGMEAEADSECSQRETNKRSDGQRDGTSANGSSAPDSSLEDLDTAIARQIMESDEFVEELRAIFKDFLPGSDRQV